MLCWIRLIYILLQSILVKCNIFIYKAVYVFPRPRNDVFANGFLGAFRLIRANVLLLGLSEKSEKKPME